MIADPDGLAFEQTVSVSIAPVNDAPTGLTLTSTKVKELRAGAAVGALSAKDAFLFTTKLGSSNVDTLHDFQLSDAIWLENKIFKGIGSGSLSKPKTMLEDAFHLGPTAQDAEDRILYDQTTGALSYDPDGIGAAAAVRFAVVATRKALTVHDFYAI